MTQNERLKEIRRAVMPGGSLTVSERLNRCRIALYAHTMSADSYTTNQPPPPVPADSSDPPPIPPDGPPDPNG